MKAMVLIVAAVLIVPGLARAEEKPPSFKRDIQPIMTTYCVKCHKPGKAKAGLDLTSFQSMMKGGKKGKKFVTPGKPESSKLVLTMEGRKPVMPPRKERKKPTKAEIALVRAWILSGAKDDSTD